LNEETHLQDACLLRISSVLVARSSVASPAAPMPLASHPVALSASRGASTGLHCDHYGRDRHVKKAHKAQACHSSQSTGGSSSGGFEMCSTSSET
jgi:hypothetical protein